MLKKILFIFCLTGAVLQFGCASPYIGKNRQEIVDIIAQEYKTAPKATYIYVPGHSNYRFNYPGEILDADRNWGPDMTKFDQWGILPYKKFLYDGTFYTVLTFKNDIVVKEAEVYSGGYGFKPLTFIFLLFACAFAP